MAFNSYRHKGKEKKTTPQLLSLSCPSSLHMIGQMEMKGNYSCVLMWMEDAFWDMCLSIFIHCISVHVGGKRNPLAQGHTTRDMLNTHLDMPFASMLGCVQEHTYTHSTRLHSGWLLWGKAVLSCHLLFRAALYVYFQPCISL